MDLLDRIKESVKKKGMTVASLEKEIGLSSGAIVKWKTSFPSYDKVLKVAKILDENIEWLLTGEISQVTELQNLSFVQKFLNLSDENKTKIEGMIELKIYEQNLEEENRRNASLYNKEEIFSEKKNSVFEHEENYDSVITKFGDYKLDDHGNLIRIDYDADLIEVLDFAPVVGWSAAGNFIEMSDEGIYDMRIAKKYNSTDFFLHMKGKSMEPLISDNSFVEVSSTSYVENGTIAIVSIDDKVTCKKLYSDGNGRVELVSINPDYDNIVLELNEENADSFRVIGKVNL